MQNKFFKYLTIILLGYLCIHTVARVQYLRGYQQAMSEIID